MVIGHPQSTVGWLFATMLGKAKVLQGHTLTRWQSKNSKRARLTPKCIHQTSPHTASTKTLTIHICYDKVIELLWRGSECRVSESIFKFCVFSLNFLLILMKSGTEQLNSDYPKERSMTCCVCICVCVNQLTAPSGARCLAITQLMCIEVN